MSDASGEAGTVISVNAGLAQPFTDGRRTFTSAIGKKQRAGRVAMHGAQLDGDEQADLDAHGGPDRALYAYAAEDYGWWEGELGRPLRIGLFGENLTLRGIDVSGAAIGERWRVGNALLRVTSPRVPCYKLAHVVGETDFVKRFADALRPGAYLAIEEHGDVGAGDDVTIVSRPNARLTLAEFARIYFHDHARIAQLLDIPDITDAWRAWAERKVADSERRTVG